METTQSFNMFGYRTSGSSVNARELHFGYAQLWDGSAANVQLQNTGQLITPLRVNNPRAEGALGANCLKSKSEEVLGENKGKIMKDGAIAQLKIQKL